MELYVLNMFKLGFFKITVVYYILKAKSMKCEFTTLNFAVSVQKSIDS